MDCRNNDMVLVHVMNFRSCSIHVGFADGGLIEALTKPIICRFAEQILEHASPGDFTVCSSLGGRQINHMSPPELALLTRSNAGWPRLGSSECTFIRSPSEWSIHLSR